MYEVGYQCRFTPYVASGREQMRPRLIFATLTVSAALLAGCASTSHHPPPLEPRVQVIGVSGAIGPETPKERQVERELRGVEGGSR